MQWDQHTATRQGERHGRLRQALLFGLCVEVANTIHLLADGLGSSSVALMGRHECDPAVAVKLVIPIHKGLQRLAGVILMGMKPAWEIRPIPDGSEQEL
jgi:hypothetical protein